MNTVLKYIKENPIKRHRVLIINYENSITIEIDLIRPLLFLFRMDVIDVTIVTIKELTDNTLINHDVIIFTRSIDDISLSWMKRANKANLKIIYCIDDNFLTIPPMDNFSIYCNHEKTKRCFIKIINTANLVKASTEHLAEYLLKYNSNTIYRKYTFDLELLDPNFIKENKDTIKIGSFCAPGRDYQFGFVMEALLKIAKNYINTEFEFIGYIPFNIKDLISVAGENRVFTSPVILPYYNSIKFLQKRNWDIGLAPLLDNEFNKSKSITKYRDYAALKIAGIYSNIETYNKYIINNEKGLLVNNIASEWYNAIEQYILNKELLETVQKNSYKDIEDNYNVYIAVKDWYDIFKNL